MIVTQCQELPSSYKSSSICQIAVFSAKGACGRKLSGRSEGLKISLLAVCERRSHRKLVDVVSAAWATMATGAKHVLLVALVTLLLTCAECRQDTFRQGRKDLSNSQLPETTLVLGDDWVTETDNDTLEDATLTPTLVESEEEPSEEAAELFSEEPAVEETEELPTADDSFNLEGNADNVDVETEENVNWFAEAQEDSGEAPFEGREMLEAKKTRAKSPPPPAEGPSAIIVNPNQTNFPDPRASKLLHLFLQSLNDKNSVSGSIEPKIQRCIHDKKCGKPKKT